jgi:hypothetical protein
VTTEVGGAMMEEAAGGSAAAASSSVEIATTKTTGGGRTGGESRGMADPALLVIVVIGDLSRGTIRATDVVAMERGRFATGMRAGVQSPTRMVGKLRG